MFMKSTIVLKTIAPLRVVVQTQPVWKHWSKVAHSVECYPRLNALPSHKEQRFTTGL